jgi:hypothetical protein
MFTKISEFIFEKQQRCKDGSKVSPSKFSLGPLDLDYSLTIQWIFKIQSILASFIVNHVISINLITPVHTDAFVPTVTTPSEIIPYYRLNPSIWSLSDNKESSC